MNVASVSPLWTAVISATSALLGVIIAGFLTYQVTMRQVNAAKEEGRLQREHDATETFTTRLMSKRGDVYVRLIEYCDDFAEWAKLAHAEATMQSSPGACRAFTKGDNWSHECAVLSGFATKRVLELFEEYQRHANGLLALLYSETNPDQISADADQDLLNQQMSELRHADRSLVSRLAFEIQGDPPEWHNFTGQLRDPFRERP